ncbi:MAG TPA: guanine deaminase [Tissierellales bacterium]|nr:guanine deaminase [Tissierellales bacterium]
MTDRENILIFKGNIAFTPTKDSFITYENHYLIVKNGKVEGIYPSLDEKYNNIKVRNIGDKIIIPGFVDLHFHAPQYPNRGLGLDKELIPWLETYTFPEEGKYKDIDYAEKVYTKMIEDIWKNGTTRISLFSSVHKESTKLLLDLLIKSGLGGYVGKVNMDRNTSEYLTEDTNISLKETEEILIDYNNKSSVVKPIITPRFVPTCTPELLEALGKLSKEYNIPIQSHLNENIGEVEWVKELHPESENYSSVYNNFGLFGQQKTIMAHCIHNTEEELVLMAENQVHIAHCPHSNYNLSSGIMPVRTFLDKGIPVGLGSDVSGGHKVSITNVMVSAIQASKIKWLETNKELAPLTTSEAFYLGTKGGGSFFGKVGSFEKDYDFDALIIDDSNLGNFKKLSLEERIQRFIYIGDDRNIEERYVQGVKVEKPLV